jgi:hypothetical protein
MEGAYVAAVRRDPDRSYECIRKGETILHDRKTLDITVPTPCL